MNKPTRKKEIIQSHREALVRHAESKGDPDLSVCASIALEVIEYLETEIARLEVEKEAYAKEAFEAARETIAIRANEYFGGKPNTKFPTFEDWQRSREK